MELESIVNKNKEYKANRILSVIVIICSLLFAAYSYNNSNEKVKYAQDNMRYIDYEGNVFSSRPIEKQKARKLEAKDHIKDFYTLIYQFDKYTYKTNMGSAQQLAGRCFEEIFDQYERQEVFEKLVSLNMRLYVEIDSILIENNEKGYVGIIYGKQMSIREVSNQGNIEEVKSKRLLNVGFDAVDMLGKSDGNPHGLLIENWKVLNWDEIK